MAKFSVEEEVDDEFCVRSPKKRRTCSTSQPNPHDHDHDHEEQDQSDDNNHDGDGDGDSTSRTNSSGSAAPFSVILSDPDVLDCSICFEPLTIPVFQCDNGHIACSTCCNNLNNKCPTCCGRIGNNRCRAIEKVIESVKVPCCYTKNGCKETVSYCKKHEHEEKCRFAPCLCPFTGCLFRGSPRKLSHHMSMEHGDLLVRFRYNSVFSVSMGMDENFLVLQEKTDDRSVFILSHGNTIALRSLDSSSSKDGYKYDIVLSRGCSSLKFQSSTHGCNGQLSMAPSVDYVMVPGYFYNTSGRLELEVCVHSKDDSTRT